MQGQSVLSQDPSPIRPIYSTAVTGITLQDDAMALDLQNLKPPFYQFGLFNVNVCNQRIGLDILKMTWYVGEISGHTAPCNSPEMPELDQIQKMLLAHLRASGFNTSSIPQNLPVKNRAQ
jgi:hypothetical protein